MKLLGHDGRKALLEFLRNLTPQILLLSSAMALFVSSAKPDAKSPLLLQILGVGLAGIFLIALYSNFENFLNAAFSDIKFISAEKKRLLLVEKSGIRRIILLLSSIATHSKITFVELLLAILIIYGAMFCILIGAVAAALGNGAT